MAKSEIQKIEKQIYDLNLKLIALRKSTLSQEAIPNYTFSTQSCETNLIDLFGQNDKLLLIHNMGQACRY
ncbi:hypothetical protein [Pseudoalteromonas denitrificans]|uniref:Uncharacterized protein n=1 Tax=Pseudoalteromonas denitrificans DSM 6059 TaxID=1123010 RepID=A0A1I1M0R0_9GAMM|nr:hypothetical protein [Pseudoalteromonas denitrificans]SFC78954.1 hypothetical protein SAMN02745724_02552 [Pseudoalteromonas denitrificans DSM 6059]